MHGTELLLMQSANQSFIIAETETAFVVVNLSVGPEGAMNDARYLLDRNELEHFADLINFRQLR